jgi:hypothetical protein
MEFNFDTNGYLFPNQIFDTDLKRFEATFVTNEHRQTLFIVLQNYIEDLKITLKAPFRMWIDGSFVTEKKRPNDIDLVTFINAPNYFQSEIILHELLKTYQRLDAHYCAVYPFNHRLRYVTDWEIGDYKELYLSDRNKVKKGLIQLNF